jgi:hypothetical protein
LRRLAATSAEEIVAADEAAFADIRRCRPLVGFVVDRVLGPLNRPRPLGRSIYRAGEHAVSELEALFSYALDRLRAVRRAGGRAGPRRRRPPRRRPASCRSALRFAHVAAPVHVDPGGLELEA